MLATMASCLVLLTQAAPDRPEVLRGAIVEKGTGRPLAGISIRFSDEPEAPVATTDELGQFDRLPVGQLNAVPRDGQQGPYGRVRAGDDRAWPWELVQSADSVRYPPGFLSKRAIESLYVRVETRWKGNGPGGSLVVECPPVGSIEAIVRGPDGSPAADRPIFVMPAAEIPSIDNIGIRFSGRTDRSGAFRLQSFEGVRQFAVQVPGLGFGSTGRVEITGGKVARPEIPPLARFGRVEGRLAPSLLAPGMEVALIAEPSPRAVGPMASASCDEQGRFSLADVVPGAYQIVARKGDQAVRIAQRIIRVGPGQVLENVVLEPAWLFPPVLPKLQALGLQGLNGDRNRIITLIEGTIRDEKEQPLPGALVYLHFQYDGGLRTAEEARVATADDRGRYRFEGPSYSGIGMLTVVATAEGRPPAIAYALPSSLAREGDKSKPAQLDVALARTGASASVAVIQDGKKLDRVAVQLSLKEPAGLSNSFYVGRSREPERSKIEALVAPTARTGPDGIARFENLFPGAYELTASNGPNPHLPIPFSIPWRRGQELPFGVADGIAVPTGGEIKTTANVYPQSKVVRFRLLRPDGSPMIGRTVSFSFGLGRMRSTSLNVDEQGIASCHFDKPGLWAVEFRFRDSEPKSFPIQEEPFDTAEALIPISPGLPLEDPITLRASHRGQGAIRARLLGADGQPVRGIVMIIDGSEGTVRQAGTVDVEGSIRFPNLPSGKYRLRGVIDGQEPALRPQLGATRLDDADLRGRAMVFDREVILAPGAETSTDLRLEPVGYIRVTLRAPAGRSSSDYTASLESDEPRGDFRGHEVDLAGKSYLFGPARAGRWPIVLREKVNPGPNLRRGERMVVIEPGQVVRAEVEPDASPERSKASGSVGLRLPNSGPEGFFAKVFLPDGMTPAFAARALFFPADGRKPIAEGVADATGRLTWAARWMRQSDRDDENGPASVKEPTIVAWMPGLAGPVAAAIEPDKPLRVVLPAPAGASGRVAIGGRGIEGRNARVRVVVAAEGRGALAVAFGREVTAEPDGRFRFSGLAPGRYVVQAVRDDIWLSNSVPLVVEDGKDAVPIDLDIPEPGETAAFDFVDADGQPLPGLAFSIRRPAGPLAEALPINFRANEHGSVIVRGLAVGAQSLVADGDPNLHDFAISPAVPEGQPRGIRIVVSRPTP